MRVPRSAVAGIVAAGLVLAGILAWPVAEGWLTREFAQRLSAETGRPWTVGGVSLRLLPSPQIVARDLAFEDTAGSGRIREARLDGPLALLGSGGTLHIIAEGLDLRVPLASAPAAEKRRPADIAALRAAFRGASAALSEDGRTLSLAAQSADLSVTTAASAARTDIQARFEFAESALDIAGALAVSGNEPGAFTLTLAPKAGGHRIEAKGLAKSRPDGLTLDGVAGTIDGEPFSGSLGLSTGSKPRLALDLKLDALALVDAADPLAGKGGAPGLVVAVTPEFVPDIRWFEGFEGKGNVAVARLRLGPATLTGVTLTGSIKDGTLDAAFAAAGLYEGQARGRYVLAPDPGKAGRHQLGVSLTRIGTKPFLADIAAVRGLDGLGTARIDLQATGNRTDEVARSVSGRAELAVVDGRIDGFDLAGAFGLLPGGGQGRSGGLATRLDRLAGSFDVAEGQAFTNDLALKTALIEATGVGRLDLTARTLDFRFKPQVATGKRPGARLDVPVHVSGPWANPNVSADLSGIAANPSGAIESLQDLGGKLFGEDGGNLGENLGGLLDSLMPRSEPQSPAPRQPGRRRSLSPE